MALGDGRYRIDGVADDLDIETSSFFEWILTVDSEPGRRARLAFDDFAYRNRMYAPKHLDLALAQVAAVGDDGTLDLNLKGGEAVHRSPSGATSASSRSGSATGSPTASWANSS